MKNAAVIHQTFAPKTEARYLYLEGIDGQCTEALHKNWIAVTEEHVDENGNFVFTHKADRATLKIDLFCMFHQMIGNMRFHICEHGAIIKQMKLENIRIKSVYTYTGADGTARETVTLACA